MARARGDVEDARGACSTLADFDFCQHLPGSSGGLCGRQERDRVWCQFFLPGTCTYVLLLNHTRADVYGTEPPMNTAFHVSLVRFSLSCWRQTFSSTFLHGKVGKWSRWRRQTTRENGMKCTVSKSNATAQGRVHRLPMAP